jgi:hypothetical protein
MSIKTKTTYIASDGKEFSNEDAAKQHEESITGLAKFSTFKRTAHNVITHAQAKEIVRWQLSNSGRSILGGVNKDTCWHIGKVEIFQLLDFIYGHKLKPEQRPPFLK